MNYRCLCSALLVLLCYSTAVAEDMSGFLGRAAAVGVILVSSGTEKLKSELANGCGVAYTGVVTNGIVNMEDGKPIHFRARTSLSIAGTYLVFLTDTIDSSADPASILTGIRSETCASSGIRLTAMIIGEGESRTIGPEAIMESRHRPGGRQVDYHLSALNLFGNRAFAKLLSEEKQGVTENLEPLFVDVERAEFVEHGVAYPEDTLLQVLKKLANPGYQCTEKTDSC